MWCPNHPRDKAAHHDRSKLTSGRPDWKALFADDADHTCDIVRADFPAILEVKMGEALGRTRKTYRRPSPAQSRGSDQRARAARAARRRDGRFLTQLLERCSRRETAVVGALTEMYVQEFVRAGVCMLTACRSCAGSTTGGTCRGVKRSGLEAAVHPRASVRRVDPRLRDGQLPVDKVDIRVD